MFTWKRTALAAGAIILFSLLFITLVLPGMIIERASRWVAEETGRKLAIESISINPFGLTVEVDKLVLSDTDHSKPFVSWDLLRVSLSTASIWHREPVIDELTLNQPKINLERLTERTFNFSDLIPAQEKTPKPTETDSEPARFSVNNINISDAQILLTDSSLEQPVHHEISDLYLVLPSIGNLPHMVEDPAQPLFKAVINDSPIDIEGHLTPFTDSHEMQFNLELENIDIPFYLSYIPVELPVDIRNGKLHLNLDILYRFSEAVGNELILSGQVDLAALNIWDKQQEQLFFLPLMQVEVAPSQPINQDIHLSAVRLYNLEVQLNRDRQGTWNHARMAQTNQEQPAVEESEETTSPFKLLIDAVEIRDGVVVFADQLPAGGFETVAKEINININNFSLDTQSGIPFTLSLQTERNETAEAKGHFQLKPFSLALETTLTDIQLGAYNPYYQELYNQPMGGTLGLKASLMINPEQPLLISNGQITLRDFSGAYNDDEGFTIDTFDINGLSYDLNRNHLAMGKLASSNARANFSRNKEGEFSYMSRNFPILAKLAEASANAKPSEAPLDESEEAAFSYRIDEVNIENWQLDIEDRMPRTPAKLEIDDLSLVMKDLTAPEKVKSPFDFGMTLQRKGRVEIQGSIALSDLETSITTRLKKIPLASLAPYVAEQTNLVLAKGSLNATLNTLVTPQEDELAISFDGNVGIGQMHLLDGTHREDLLKWESLQVNGIKGNLSPASVSIDSVTLSDYFAKILIDKETRLNLTEAFRKPGEDPEKGNEEEPVSAEQAEEETTTRESKITIDKVVLQGGQVDFTDQSLPRTFHADMRELGGRIDGLSSDTAARAEVDLRGNLRNQSPLNISGTINPLSEDLFLDIELNFRDIEMSPFSPYSGNFVGYMIEKGKLNLSLEYTVEDGQLKANNKVFLDQFSFGEAVESEDAINLPVKLAVALLKDGSGEIHLDIPVSGSLDDPQFSIGGVVWTVIKNLLVKAATSPFALLGALIGGGEEDFSSVSFDYGSANLNTAEQEKLTRIAQALLERPSLEVEISGFIDPEKDPEGYRKEQLSSQIKRLKYLDLVKSGELPEEALEEDVSVLPEEYAEYLWQAYSEAEFPKPRNFIGMTKKLPEAEMEKLIYANTVVDENQLAQLAQARALAVQNFLTTQGQLAPERVFLKKPEVTSSPEQETAYRARVELDATIK